MSEKIKSVSMISSQYQRENRMLSTWKRLRKNPALLWVLSFYAR